jgi:hypothetical protein
MSSNEYLTELRSYLDTLPESECEAAITFYRNEFNKGDSETSVMLRLGNPYSLAKRIIAESSDFNDSTIYKNLKKDGMTNAFSLKTGYKEPETDILPKVKTAYDKPQASYASPPAPKNIKSERRKIGAIIGVFIGVFTAAIFFVTMTSIVSARTYKISHDIIEATAMPVPVYEVSPEPEAFDENYLPPSLVTNSISIHGTDTHITINHSDTYRVEHSGTIDITNSGEEAEIIGNGGEVTIYLNDDIEHLNIVLTGGTLTFEPTEIMEYATLNLSTVDTQIITIPVIQVSE